MDKLLLSWPYPRTGFCVDHLTKCGSRNLVVSLTNGKKNSIVLIDLHTSQSIAEYDFNSKFPAVGLAPGVSNNEQALLCRADGSAWMFDLCTFNQPFKVIKTEKRKKMQECCAGAVSGNGNTVALGISGANNSSKKKRPKKSHSSESDSESDEDENWIELWDMRNGNMPLHTYKECHNDKIQALNFSAESNRLLISGDADGLVNCLDTTRGADDDALQSSSQLGSSINHVSFLSGSRAYATTDDNRFEIFQLNAPDDVDIAFKKDAVANEFLVDILDIDRENICALYCSALGAASARFFSNNGCAALKKKFAGHSDLIRCLLYDSNERLLITGDDSGLVTARELLPVLGKVGPVTARKKNRRPKPY